MVFSLSEDRRAEWLIERYAANLCTAEIVKETTSAVLEIKNRVSLLAAIIEVAS